MIDNLKIKISFDPPSLVVRRVNTTFRLFGLSFDPVVRKGVVIRYKSSIGNLHLSIREDVLTVQNSISKYILGNNYINLTHTQLCQGVNHLCNELGFNLLEAQIVSFEFGGVIHDNNISKTLINLGHNKGNRPLPMQVNGRVYGTFYENSTHKLKFYDKSFEVKKRTGIIVQSNLLRIEKSYSKSYLDSLVLLKNTKIKTLGDLLDWHSLELLSEDLVSSISKIEMRSLPQFIQRMSPRNLRAWCYLQDPYFRNYMKKHHLKAFETDRALINKIIKEYRKNGYDTLVEEVRDKLNFCLEN